MKAYSVVYLAEAEEDLVLLWEDTSDRNRVAEAANAADEKLGATPNINSVYLGEELWRLDIPPLRFYFVIRDEDRIVEVSNVVRVNG